MLFVSLAQRVRLSDQSRSNRTVQPQALLPVHTGGMTVHGAENGPSWLGETRNGNWTSRPGTERRRRAVTAPEARRVRPQLEEPRADPAGQGDGRQAGEPRQDREAAGTVGPEAVTKAHPASAARRYYPPVRAAVDVDVGGGVQLTDPSPR